MDEEKVTVEVLLPYFKKGDDLLWCLEQTKNNPEEAFRKHVEIMGI